MPGPQSHLNKKFPPSISPKSLLFFSLKPFPLLLSDLRKRQEEILLSATMEAQTLHVMEHPEGAGSALISVLIHLKSICEDCATSQAPSTLAFSLFFLMSALFLFASPIQPSLSTCCASCSFLAPFHSLSAKAGTGRAGFAEFCQPHHLCVVLTATLQLLFLTPTLPWNLMLLHPPSCSHAHLL